MNEWTEDKLLIIMAEVNKDRLGVDMELLPAPVSSCEPASNRNSDKLSFSLIISVCFIPQPRQVYFIFLWFTCVTRFFFCANQCKVNWFTSSYHVYLLEIDLSKMYTKVTEMQNKGTFH